MKINLKKKLLKIKKEWLKLQYFSWLKNVWLNKIDKFKKKEKFKLTITSEIKNKLRKRN